MDFRETFRRARDAQGDDASNHTDASRRFLMVYFECCHVYDRMYRNRVGTHYSGKCPKCGSLVNARIGPGGTCQRIFRAR